ncbi:MAG: hypothetical protein P4M00_03700 [Azospirillaceae bacterium]|nr:hypothetical protein [Azospirillaceae bacterium]
MEANLLGSLIVAIHTEVELRDGIPRDPPMRVNYGDHKASAARLRLERTTRR